MNEKVSKGDRVRCLYSNDQYDPLPSGAEGTVSIVDSVGTVHVRWDNGRRLGLVPDEDRWEKILPDPDEIAQGVWSSLLDEELRSLTRKGFYEAIGTVGIDGDTALDAWWAFNERRVRVFGDEEDE